MEKLGPKDFPTNTQNLQTTKEEIPDEYFEEEKLPYGPLENCPKCKGAGFVHRKGADGTIDYSKVFPCNYPGCYLDQVKVFRHKKIVADSVAGSSIIDRSQTFENFDEKVPGVQQAYKAAWQIAEGVNADYKWLLIYGGVGNGKSHLLNAIANRLIMRGLDIKFMLMADLLSELRIAMNTNQTDSKVQELKTVSYLIIDELGIEYGTDWEREKIEQILSSRWSRGLHTIIATNWDFEKLSPRLKSRFKDRRYSRYVLNRGEDYREKKR